MLRGLIGGSRIYLLFFFLVAFFFFAFFFFGMEDWGKK
jgi:hypothetical protein